MAIGAIGFFGRGDLMRQRMYYNAQRNPPMPMSSFAQGGVVDVGLMPGSVEAPVRGENAAVPAVSGWGSFDGWGRVTSGQVLSAVVAAPLGPLGIALALKKNNQSIAHAQKQVKHFTKLYAKVRSKNRKDKRIAMVTMKLAHWKRVLAQLQRKKAQLQKMKTHKKWERGFTRKAKKAARKGQITMTPAQKRRLLAAQRQSQIIASRSMYPGASTTYALPTAAQAASMASLATSSGQGAMVPPGSYDYMAATALPTTATSNGYAPAQLVGQRAQDVDMNDDGIRDDQDFSTTMAPDGSRTMDPNGDDAALEEGDGGIMDKVQNFFGGIPRWAIIGGVVVVGGVAYSRTSHGKRMLAKLKRGGSSGE